MTYCNYGGVINTENPKKHGVTESNRERKQKREEALHFYRPGKLLEIVLSLSRTEILWCEKRKYFDPEYSPGSLKTSVSI